MKNPDLEQRRKALCDEIIERAAQLIVGEVGASIPMLIDRMLTHAAAHAALQEGSAVTAQHFRELADNIEAGVFWPITGENRPGDKLN